MSSSRLVIIKVNNEAIWFNDTDFVRMHHTNLPVGDFRIVDTRPIYWEVEMNNYDRQSGILTVRIINFRPSVLDEFLNQRPKADIKELHIKDIYWPAFSADLSYFKKTAFLPLLSDVMPIISAKETVIHLNVKVAFSKVHFGAGYVAFDFRFNWTNEKTEIRIYNSHILPEFEYIKSYFAKHFNSRIFEVLIVVTKSESKIQKVIATSGQIEQIKDVAIETMKFVQMEKLKKLPKFIKDIDKSLFTPEDIFEPFEKNMPGINTMSQKELFEHIMSWKDIRNKRQLEYLSGAMHDLSEKIRFTLTPKFGFLFVSHGDRMIHYIWEMLNTNATYIWSFEKGVWTQHKQLEKMEQVISYIRNHGRDSYLRTVLHQEEILFRRILHQGAGSQLVDYFPRWRHSLNEAIL